MHSDLRPVAAALTPLDRNFATSSSAASSMVFGTTSRAGYV